MLNISCIRFFYHLMLRSPADLTASVVKKFNECMVDGYLD